MILGSVRILVGTILRLRAILRAIWNSYFWIACRAKSWGRLEMGLILPG
jgi:hypothetical protein